MSGPENEYSERFGYEPYEELDPELLQHAILVLRKWAASQRNTTRPILEFLDGSTVTPEDLLAEPPPVGRIELSLDEVLERTPDYIYPEESYAGRARAKGRQKARRIRRRVTGRQMPRAWAHVLNLVAVSDMHSDEDAFELLAEIEKDSDVAGPAGPAVA